MNKVTMGEVNFTLVPPYHHEICRITIGYEVIWKPKLVENFCESKRLFPLPGFEPLTLQLLGRSLYRLRHAGSRESL